MLLELILVKNFNKIGDLFRDDSPTSRDSLDVEQRAMFPFSLAGI